LPSPAVRSELSDLALFRFFFIRVAFMESVVKQTAAKGKDTRAARSAIADEFKLTSTEASLLREIALDCRVQDESFLKQTASQRKTLSTTLSRGGPEVDQARTQMRNLESDYDRIVARCLDRLRNGMGQARFDRLARLVRAVEAPRIQAEPRMASKEER